MTYSGHVGQARPDGHPHPAEDADVIVAQAGRNAAGALDTRHIDWIGRLRRPEARLIVIPFVSCRALTPQYFYIPELESSLCGYHDVHAMQFFLNDLGVSQFLGRTDSSDFFSEYFACQELHSSLLDLVDLERGSGANVTVSDLLVEAVVQRQGFLAPDRPDMQLLGEFSRRILMAMGKKSDGNPANCDWEDEVVLPPYLSTLLGLNHESHDVDIGVIKLFGNNVMREDYFEEIFRLYKGRGRDRVIDLLQCRADISRYINRYHACRKRCHGNDTRQIVSAVYEHCFGRRPTSSEVYHQVRYYNRFGIEALVSFYKSLPTFVNLYAPV